MRSVRSRPSWRRTKPFSPKCKHGSPPKGSRPMLPGRYVLGMFNRLCLDVIEVGAEWFESIAAKAQMPGCLNEEALRRLTDAA